MAEKKIQPKAAETKSAVKKTAAAGVEKKSLARRAHKLSARHAAPR
jgi:hypothetical protein